jgi:hypothetical protein
VDSAAVMKKQAGHKAGRFIPGVGVYIVGVILSWSIALFLAVFRDHPATLL